MISDKMAAKINDQIKNELYSGHPYLSMAAYCSSIDMDGFANFFIIQELCAALACQGKGDHPFSTIRENAS